MTDTKLTTTAAKKARKASKASSAAPAKAAAKPEAKAAPVIKAQVAEVARDLSGNFVTVKATDGRTFKFPNSVAMNAAMEKFIQKGRGFDLAEKQCKEALEATKTPGHLAKGVDARNSPHSAKAVGDRKAKEKPLTKAAQNDHRAIREEKARKAKAEKQAKAAPKADDNRKITIVDKKFTYGKEGTSRRASWDACVKAKTVADYAAKGGALKYLPRWTAAGAIKLG